MIYSPVRGDNPRAVASGQPLVQADKLRYNCFINVDRVDCKIFRAKLDVFWRGWYKKKLRKKSLDFYCNPLLILSPP